MMLTRTKVRQVTVSVMRAVLGFAATVVLIACPDRVPGEMETYADRVCACTDAACLEQAAEDAMRNPLFIAANIDDPEMVRARYGDNERVTEAMARIEQCRARIPRP